MHLFEEYQNESYRILCTNILCQKSLWICVLGVSVFQKAYVNNIYSKTNTIHACIKAEYWIVNKNMDSIYKHWWLHKVLKRSHELVLMTPPGSEEKSSTCRVHFAWTGSQSCWSIQNYTFWYIDVWWIIFMLKNVILVIR